MLADSNENSQDSRRGRRPAKESHADSYRARLVTWRQIPEEQRPSLRALAGELGTTHQLLNSYLKGLSKWQQQEYHRKAQVIRDKGWGMTYAEEQQMLAYDRAALQVIVDDALEPIFQRLETRENR